jgi:hypothetical protein
MFSAARKHYLAVVPIALVVLSACSPRAQTYVGGRQVDPQRLTPEEVARAVQITPRGDDVFFQAPPIQAIKVIDLRSAGAEMGVELGEVSRVRFGYLFGALNRRSGAIRHYLLFQSNFVIGHDRYAAVTTAAGRPLEFRTTRAEDPCVPNCFPVLEELIVSLPADVLSAGAASGLALNIALTDGQVIRIQGLAAYVRGYLQAVEQYAPR